jgi:hypothetical protein
MALLADNDFATGATAPKQYQAICRSEFSILVRAAGKNTWSRESR